MHLGGERQFPYDIMPSYPHLSENEAKIWTSFVLNHPNRFDKVYYDVCVGDFRGKEDLKPEWDRNRRYLGKYKIDVVGVKGEETTIVELKKNATSKALGEIWLYWHLFKRDFKGEKEPKLLIITDTEMPNIREVANADNVEFIVV